LFNQEIESPLDRVKRSFGSSLMLQDEFMIGHVGIIGGMAVVLYQPYFSGGPIYQQIGVQYHFANLNQRKYEKLRNLFAGVYLKTHWANAELVKVGIGVEW
jgi:hypothetical protein